MSLQARIGDIRRVAWDPEATPDVPGRATPDRD